MGEYTDEYSFQKELSIAYTTTYRGIVATRNWKQFRPSS